MAVTNLSVIRSSLAPVSSYITNPQKTIIPFDELDVLHTDGDIATDCKESAVLVRGINCSPSTAIKQFYMIKDQYGKQDGIQAYHGCISFAENEVTPRETIDIATEFVRKVWGDDFQVLLACHNNTQHLHCHFLVNSVSFVDGQKLHGEGQVWFKFSKVADQICREHSKSVIEKPQRSHLNKKLTLREKRAKECFDAAMSVSSSYSEFVSVLSRQKCEFNVSLGNKWWHITPFGWTNPVMIAKFGEGYKRDNVLMLFPDVSEEVERFEIPRVLKIRVAGVQKGVQASAMKLIAENKIENPLFPEKIFLKRKIKNKVTNLCDALSVMIEKKIESLPSLMSFLDFCSREYEKLREHKEEVYSYRETFELSKNIQNHVSLIGSLRLAIQAITKDDRESEIKELSAPTKHISKGEISL